jgi:predicted nucleic acid-binding Zn ribbon protein
MVRAGELLWMLFDERLAAEAQNMTRLFSSWKAVAIEERIASAVDHSRIAEFERNVLLIEADHSGWIQILQMKQQELLNNFQRRFPHMGVRGISFRLSRGPIRQAEEPKKGIIEKPTEKKESAVQENEVFARFEKDETLKRIVERLEKSLK